MLEFSFRHVSLRLKEIPQPSIVIRWTRFLGLTYFLRQMDYNLQSTPSELHRGTTFQRRGFHCLKVHSQDNYRHSMSPHTMSRLLQANGRSALSSKYHFVGRGSGWCVLFLLISNHLCCTCVFPSPPSPVTVVRRDNPIRCYVVGHRAEYNFEWFRWYRRLPWANLCKSLVVQIRQPQDQGRARSLIHRYKHLTTTNVNSSDTLGLCTTLNRQTFHSIE